jgi:acyl carrier protein
MEIGKKIALLEDILELDTGTLKAEMELDTIESWDSMAKIALIAMMDDEFSKKISAAHIRELHTVNDILALME